MQLNMQLQKGGSQLIELSDAVFGCPFNETLVHQLLTAFQAGARQGTHAQKTRGEVRGGGRKPWRQKGTGRARAGSIRSPIWRKGGVTFAAQPQDYSQKINKKMVRAALRSIYSALIRDNRLLAFDEFSVELPKTRVLAQDLKTRLLDQVLIVVHAPDEALSRAAQNLPQVSVQMPHQINPVDLVRYSKTLMTLPALKQIEVHLS